MEIILNRFIFNDTSTIGKVFVDNKFICYSLEDKIREIPGTPVFQWKIKGQTAIPVGRYAVCMYNSPRWGKEVPSLLNVPGFMDIEIHAGNAPKDTEGCILLGLEISNDREFIFHSKDAVATLQPMIEKALANKEASKDALSVFNNAPQEVYITIQGLGSDTSNPS